MRTTNHAASLRGQAEDLYSVGELARYLGVSRWTVYRLVRRGDLRAVKVGERLRFRPFDVGAYLEHGSG